MSFKIYIPSGLYIFPFTFFGDEDFGGAPTKITSAKLI
jgi:hypothetical protein